MTSQSVSRKRPAPGTSPVVHPPLGPVSNFPPNPGSQLSNDQFLQWGQNPPATVVNPSSFPDAGSYAAATAFPSGQDVPAAATATSNQLARRQPPTQLVSRNRGYEQASTTFPDHNGGTGDSGGWGESLDHLYQRALVAKREAQAKRKQIPPFVQKLSR